jgi:type IV secretory pathway VirB6-like protein
VVFCVSELLNIILFLNVVRLISYISIIISFIIIIVVSVLLFVAAALAVRIVPLLVLLACFNSTVSLSASLVGFD